MVNLGFVIHETLHQENLTTCVLLVQKIQWWFVSLPVLWISQHSWHPVSIQL